MKIKFGGITWIDGWKDLLHYVLITFGLGIFASWAVHQPVFNEYWAMFFSSLAVFIVLDKLAHKILKVG